MRRAALLASVPLVFAGCVTRQDMRGLQDDLHQMQQTIESRVGGVKDQTESVQTSQADLLQEIQSLNGQISALQTNLNDSQQRMNSLSARLDDLEASLTSRMDSQIELLSGSKFVEKPLPSTAFNLANTDFARGKYDEAIKGFQNYIKQFPKSERVPEAKLKIGDSLSKQNDADGAIDAYDQLVKEFPKDKLAPTALFRKGQILESAGRKSQAREAYSQIVKTYPYAPEAKTAQDRARSLGS
ncbi:MAG: tol-pal system protein YbgF [Elusimicrobia bacterium]|nr:tol-pal system protein YbgF [Elusimicrobiota bacterium]